MSTRTANQWAYFHFDGVNFIAGQPVDGTAFVAVRDGVQPALLTRPAKIEAAKLPSGTGAVVGICYVQGSGGKLRPASRYQPISRLPVRILAGDKVVATAETDENGYFVATVAAGRYTISAQAVIEVEVKRGSTALVPLRVGKRMVD